MSLYYALGWSKQDEECEQAALSEEERLAIHNDKHGIRNNNNRINRTRAQAAAAQRVGLPDDMTIGLINAFDRALEVIPPGYAKVFWDIMGEDDPPPTDDMMAESSPERFLRAENYNTERAALRLVNYWIMRVKLFPDTFRGSMVDVGGAFINDVELMLEYPTLFRILPNDDHGRTVICFDTTNINIKDFSDQLYMIRMMWFIIHLSLERGSTQNNGVVALIICRSASWNFPKIELIKYLSKSFNECLPVKVCCRHIVFSSVAMAVVAPMMKMFHTKEARQRMQHHNSVKDSITLQELETFGLHSNNLPKSIGGSFEEEPFWINDCKRLAEVRRIERSKKVRRTKRQRN